MFGKNDSDKKADPSSGKETLRSVPSPATPKEPATDVPNAVIGPKIKIKGDLSGSEDLLIQGSVEGTIDLKDHRLVIGDQGKVKADAVAKTIHVEGAHKGDLYGMESISIRENSDVKGNLASPRVALKDGAKFRGSIDMDEVEAPKLKKGKSKSAPTAGAAKPPNDANAKN
ncbi:MAG: polymer-forming cytoskeletal protein [Pseudomonadota bacterium]